MDFESLRGNAWEKKPGGKAPGAVRAEASAPGSKNAEEMPHL
jgi:hypothetical protein